MRNFFQTNDARVLSMLRGRELTRYQIHELLASQDPDLTDANTNQILERLQQRNVVGRDVILYGLTKRGAAALELIDATRTVRRVDGEPQVHQQPAQPCVVDPMQDEMLRLRTRSPARGVASAADLRSPPPRRESLKFLEAPSRFGDLLHYRDGRVTDMAGNPV